MDLRRYGHADAHDVRAMLLDIHDEVYADDPTRSTLASVSRTSWTCGPHGRTGGAYPAGRTAARSATPTAESRARWLVARQHPAQ